MRCLRAAEPIPAEHRRAGPEQRTSDAGDVEVFVAETGEHRTRDETGDQRAEDTDEDVGERAAPAVGAGDPTGEPAAGGADDDPDDDARSGVHGSGYSIFRATLETPSSSGP